MASTSGAEGKMGQSDDNLYHDGTYLVDPKLLKDLSVEERAEAIRAARVARRAEERAEARALQRALERKEQERKEGRSTDNDSRSSLGVGNAGGGDSSVRFVSRKRRAELAENRKKEKPAREDTELSSRVRSRDANGEAKKKVTKASDSYESSSSHLSASELLAIKRSYLGKVVENAVEGTQRHDDDTIRKRDEKKNKRSVVKTQKRINFKFEWDDSEDTATDVIGVSLPSQAVRRPAQNDGTKHLRKKARSYYKENDLDGIETADSVISKPLVSMTQRDWRIFRENYDIIVRGGRAPPPLRTFRESPMPSDVPVVHSAILEAIEKTLQYREPSPIQRQAIPIGLQRRDLIGIAETGSGKTCAFGVPLCHYVLSLPELTLRSVADSGPLALVMAPTRELALQIETEFAKLLSRQSAVETVAIVGGQPIQRQAQRLRQGVHIVVGTPGRINECVEMAYMVLNQCSYVVLDEADRMIDLGFAPQIEQILDSMGGTLKSDEEEEAYRQEREDLDGLADGVPRHRLTAMFSATMPPEVEHMAKKYLRHPAIVSIGDRDSGKNTRIVQRVVFLASPAQKERALSDQLRRLDAEEKVIVFVNEKKHADGVGRMVEKVGRPCVVLHGGKSQEQREENLEAFRRGGVVLVATDVAGRGLDIPNVSHVINYDLPTRSIDNYCHRIGRTGRAGKEGQATSFITDEDEGIMAPLKAYLEKTGMPVPDRLARHPAAASVPHGGIIQ